MSENLEIKFNQKMLEVYKRAKSECSYNATRYLQMLSQNGGVATAKQLIYKSDVTEGFVVLWRCKRLDISVEATVLLPEFESLFTAEERQICKHRLEQYGYMI